MLVQLASISSARLLVIGLQLVNIKLYASYLNLDQLGVYYFLLTASYAANATLFVPIDYYQQAKLARIIEISGGVLPLLVLNVRITKAYALLGFAISVFCYFFKFEYLYYSVGAILMAWVLYVAQSLRNMLNNLGHSHVVSSSVVLEAVLRVVTFLLFAIFMQANAFTLMLSWILALALASIHLVAKAVGLGLFKGDSKERLQATDVFEFSAPIAILAVCNWLQLQGYRLVLVPLGFVDEVGIFATLSGIGGAAAGAINQIYSQQFTPQLYKTSGEFLEKYLLGACAVLGVVALGGGLFGAYVAEILTNTQLANHWPLLLYGIFTDGSNLLTTALVICSTLTQSSRTIIGASILGLSATTVGFGALLLTQTVTMYSIGIPLMMSQWVAVIYMYMTHWKKTLR